MSRLLKFGGAGFVLMGEDDGCTNLGIASAGDALSVYLATNADPPRSGKRVQYSLRMTEASLETLAVEALKLLTARREERERAALAQHQMDLFMKGDGECSSFPKE